MSGSGIATPEAHFLTVDLWTSNSWVSRIPSSIANLTHF